MSYQKQREPRKVRQKDVDLVFTTKANFSSDELFNQDFKEMVRVL